MNNTWYFIAGVYLQVVLSDDLCDDCLPKELIPFQREVVSSFGEEPFLYEEKINRCRIYIVRECRSDHTAQQRSRSTRKLLQTKFLVVFEMPEEFLLEFPEYQSVSMARIEKDKAEASIFLSEGDVIVSEVSDAIREVFFCFLQQFHKIVIHSASIVYNDKAWLFSAPSGIGKTTHVRQWEAQNYPHEDLNGDLAVCYFDENGNAVAASTPWCGTSGIYSNRIVTLGGIFFLRQADQCEVKKLDSFLATVAITARTISPAWTEKQMERTLFVSEALADRVQISILNCTPKPEAARVAKEIIDSMK